MSLSNMQTSEAPSWAATSDEPASGSVGSSGMAVLKGMDNSSDAGSERGSDYIGDVEHQSSSQAPESEEWTGPGGQNRLGSWLGGLQYGPFCSRNGTGRQVNLLLKC